MRILQTIILSSLLLLIASNAYPQKDKSLQNVFIPEGYALDRNQVQYNQPKDFISYIASLGKNKVYLGCFLAKESKRLPSYYRKSFYPKIVILLYSLLFPVYFADAMIQSMQILICFQK